MQLEDHEVTTDEVRSWQGVHLLHFRGSSCSQKVRMMLAAKGVEYVSHPVNLTRHENATPWFIGINPRGVVPVLVHDGVVHVESNDIMAYVDTLPSSVRRFFPVDDDERRFVDASLGLEDALHDDLRNITMEFLLPNSIVTKSKQTLVAYETSGPPDAKRAKQAEWWRAFAAHGGVPKDALIGSLRAFRQAFDALDDRLASRAWLIGDRMSVLEVAWFVALHRLSTAGYPLHEHPNLANHYQELLTHDAFRREVDVGPAARFVMSAYGAYRRLRRSSLVDYRH